MPQLADQQDQRERAQPGLKVGLRDNIGQRSRARLGLEEHQRTLVRCHKAASVISP